MPEIQSCFGHRRRRFDDDCSGRRDFVLSNTPICSYGSDAPCRRSRTDPQAAVEEINKDRLSRALDLGILTGAVNVLKGAGTIVTQRSSVSWINPTGSPALATAGSGDALSGIIGAMFAQHF